MRKLLLAVMVLFALLAVNSTISAPSPGVSG